MDRTWSPRKNWRFFATSATTMAAMVFLAAPLYATVITATEDSTKFGNLDQAFTDCPDFNCGPTAAVNSFVYLQNMFPNIYTTPLVGTPGKTPTANDMITAANNLGQNFMKNCCGSSPGGTLIEDFILGKTDYIESKDGGVSAYTAQMALAWDPNPPNGKHPGTAKPSFVHDNTVPTLTFITGQIKDGEDVEVFLAGPAGRHYITLTGITYDDATNKGTLSFVDPDGGAKGSSPITGLDAAGLIHVTYKGNDFAVGNVVAESPVPEPASFVLVTAGGCAWFGMSRKRYGTGTRALPRRDFPCARGDAERSS
jgi:hypothetical protein